MANIAARRYTRRLQPLRIMNGVLLECSDHCRNTGTLLAHVSQPYLGHCYAACWAHHACQAKISNLDMEARPVPINGEIQQLQAQREIVSHNTFNRALHSIPWMLLQETAAAC